MNVSHRQATPSLRANLTSTTLGTAWRWGGRRGRSRDPTPARAADRQETPPTHTWPPVRTGARTAGRAALEVAFTSGVTHGGSIPLHRGCNLAFSFSLENKDFKAGSRENLRAWGGAGISWFPGSLVTCSRPPPTPGPGGGAGHPLPGLAADLVTPRARGLSVLGAILHNPSRVPGGGRRAERRPPPPPRGQGCRDGLRKKKDQC